MRTVWLLISSSSSAPTIGHLGSAISYLPSEYPGTHRPIHRLSRLVAHLHGCPTTRVSHCHQDALSRRVRSRHVARPARRRGIQNWPDHRTQLGISDVVCEPRTDGAWPGVAHPNPRLGVQRSHDLCQRLLRRIQPEGHSPLLGCLGTFRPHISFPLVCTLTSLTLPSSQDSYSGLLPRWHVNFNITMLRLISFGMDYHWASMQQSPNRPLSHTTATPTVPTSYRERVTTSLSLSEYSLTNFFAYAVYPALYIAGPIMSFNDFTHQLRHPNPLTRRALWSYAMRFVMCFLTMELVLHYMYVVAIKDSGAWQGDTPAQLCMIGFWNLIVVWLKVSASKRPLEIIV